MGKSIIEINKKLIYKLSSLALMLENVEYEDIRIENSDSYILCQQLIKSYNLFDTDEQDRFFYDIKSNHFVDGLRSDKLFYNISYNNYKEILSSALYRAKKSNMHFTPRFFMCPFHRIRRSEIKNFYEYTSSVVINGIECNKFEDAGTVYCDYNYGYIDISYAKECDEIISTISESDLKEVNIRMDSGRYYERKKLIPKKYIDRIILRRKYLYPDCIEFSLEKFYTGEEDVFELNPKNPDPDILEMMKKYRVIRELE